MNKKLSSMLIILLAYIVAFAAGIVTYLFLPDSFLLVYKLLIADLVATVLIWLISLPLKNASLYDPYWSVLPPIMIALVMIEYGRFDLPLIFLLVAVSVWAIRLTYNWGKLWTDFSHVDWRYLNFQKMAPKWYWLISFLAVMLVPTLIVFAQLVGPAFLLSFNGSLNFGTFTILVVTIIILAALLQLVADTQMQNYKKNPLNRGRIMRQGLWKYSRHPNYLGEVAVWWGVYLIYVQQFGFDGVIVAPVIMTLMFVFISVPLLEKKILKTRPEYRDYIKEAGMLVPFPKQLFTKKPIEQEK